MLLAGCCPQLLKHIRTTADPWARPISPSSPCSDSVLPIGVAGSRNHQVLWWSVNSIGQISFPSQDHLVSSARFFFIMRWFSQDLQGPGPCQYSCFLFLFLAMSLISRTVLASYLANNISGIIIYVSLNNCNLPVSSPNSISDSYHHLLELVPKNIYK